MIRLGGVASLVVMAAVLAYLAVSESQNYIIPAAVVTAVAMTGVYDLLQRKHSILRNYPVLGHIRFLLEAIRPEIQQYFIERNFDGRRVSPYEEKSYAELYEWLEPAQLLDHTSGLWRSDWEHADPDSFAPVSGRARSRVASR
jgi:hypothetical protein